MRTIVLNCKHFNQVLLKNNLSTLTSVQINTNNARIDEEWSNAKPFNQIPGPSNTLLLLSSLPGGQMYKKTLLDVHAFIRKKYGSISLLKGNFGQPNVIFTYNAEDFEKVYRTEGVWPIRIGLETFQHYRINKRPEVFKGIGGLVTEQGKSWHEIRTKVNPVLMKTQTVRHSLPQIDEIATEFLNKIPELRHPQTMEMPDNFFNEIKKWSFESISNIALNRRLGLIKSKNPDPNALRLADAMQTFFQLSFEFDVLPSFWKYYETKKFKKLMSTFDEITEITTDYIDKAILDFNRKSNEEAKSVLEKLLVLDKQIAFIMAMDMLMAGIDTTSSTLTTVLYNLAKNPTKQNKLREELIGIFPNKDFKCTAQNTKNMPYLRACIKEALRITPITPGNFRMTGQDLVLSGYQVPKGTGILMGVMALSNEEKYFPQSKEFLPERWLKGEYEDNAKKASNPFVYLPFGFGPRTCIGKRIAEMEIETLLSKFIRNYKVSWEKPDLKYTSNLIIIPISPLKFKFEEI